MEREGDNVWALEASVLLLNMMKDFPFSFLSVFPSGEVGPASSSIMPRWEEMAMSFLLFLSVLGAYHIFHSSLDFLSSFWLFSPFQFTLSP